MKILFLSFYFEPDLCAGSFRANALAAALVQADSSLELEILTTLPNRYISFAQAAQPEEQRERQLIRRFALPSHNSGMADQSHAFLAYARQVIVHARSRHYDAVLATSSRMMTASLGSLLARQKRLPLYLDIRDIFVDTLTDVLPAGLARCSLGPLQLLERFTMSRASKINLVSEGFREYFSTRYPLVPLSFFTNGIDDEFINTVRTPVTCGTEGGMEVLYAGNIGEGQGLHRIIPALAERLPAIRFRIIGDGGRMGALLQEIRRRGVSNVFLQPPIKRSELVAACLKADVLFLHLNDYPAFQKVLPSKLFEYGALGKPVWAGVAGYSAEFVRREIDNAAVFQPCDPDDALRAFSELRLRTTPRPAFTNRYSRRAIMRRLAVDVLAALAQEHTAAVSTTAPRSS